VTIVTGLCSAIGWSQPGMFSGATKADEMNVATNIHKNAIELTASAVPATSPVYAWIQLNA